LTLVLSEDGAGDLVYGDGSRDGSRDNENEVEVEDEEIENHEQFEDGEEMEDGEELADHGDFDMATGLNVPTINDSGNQSHSIKAGDTIISNASIPDQNAEIAQAAMRRILDRGEREAMEYLSKGYFRQVENIYLDSIMAYSDYWDHWETLKEELVRMCDKEKKNFPDWTRPNVSFMIVRYGFRPWKDCYEEKVHVRGDYDNGVLEEELPKYKGWVRSIYGDEDF